MDFSLDKYVLVIVLKDHCPWCAMLKTQTLPMLQAMGIKLELLKGAGVESHYGIEAFPAIVYCDTQFNKIYKEEGYVPVQRVVEVLSKLERGENPDEQDATDSDSPEQDLSTDSDINPPAVESEVEVSDQSDSQPLPINSPDETDLSPREKYAAKHREEDS